VLRAPPDPVSRYDGPEPGCPAAPDGWTPGTCGATAARLPSPADVAGEPRPHLALPGQTNDDLTKRRMRYDSSIAGPAPDQQHGEFTEVRVNPAAPPCAGPRRGTCDRGREMAHAAHIASHPAPGHSSGWQPRTGGHLRGAGPLLRQAAPARRRFPTPAWRSAAVPTEASRPRSSSRGRGRAGSPRKRPHEPRLRPGGSRSWPSYRSDRGQLLSGTWRSQGQRTGRLV